MNSNEKKTEQLGMSYGKANHQLRKSIMFDLLKKLKLDICYRCKKKIENVSELSIEHKIPWLDSEKPTELFFDLGNIAFSHLSCNIKDGRKPNKIISPKGMAWCWKCKKHKKLEDFPKGKKKTRDLKCRECNTKCRSEYRKRTGKR